MFNEPLIDSSLVESFQINQTLRWKVFGQKITPLKFLYAYVECNWTLKLARKEKRKIIECVLSEQQDEKYDFKMFLLTGEVGQLKRIF